MCGLGYHYGCVIMCCTRISLVSLGDTPHSRVLQEGNMQPMFQNVLKQISSLLFIKDTGNCIKIPLE